LHLSSKRGAQLDKPFVSWRMAFSLPISGLG